MPAICLERPADDEYAPYYGNYITRVPPGNLVTIMTDQIAVMRATFGSMDEERAGYRYAPGKWTIREVLGHLIDAERVFAYRAASISRGDPAPLPSFDQDVWLPPARYDERPIGAVLAEWEATRRATVALTEAMPAEALSRRGIASDLPFSVRALLHVPPGHATYHLEFLASRYR